MLYIYSSVRIIMITVFVMVATFLALFFFWIGAVINGTGFSCWVMSLSVRRVHFPRLKSEEVTRITDMVANQQH